MTNNSILQLIGHKENIFLNSSQAKKVDSIFADNTVSHDFVIRLTNPTITFKKSAIRMIEINDDGLAREQKELDSREFHEQERVNRNKLLLLTPRQKANFIDIFEGLFSVSSGEEAKEEDKERAKVIQEKFFIQNPKRTLCDLHLLKPIIPMVKGKISPFSTGYFRLLERAVFRDMQLSGQFKLDIKRPDIKEKAGNESLFDIKQDVYKNRKEESEYNEMINNAVNNF